MNDRLEFATQAEAQAAADALHVEMQKKDKDYEASVKAGHTTAWAIPYQLSGSKAWCVNVKDRGLKAVEAADVSKLKPIVKGELVEPPKVKAPTVEKLPK